MSDAPALQFKSRRSGSPGGLVAGPQAPATGAAAEAQSPAAADHTPDHTAYPFRPFRAYALAYPSRRNGAAMHVMTSTLAVRRSEVRARFVDFYRDAPTGNAMWAKALANGALLIRVSVAPDPEFVLPKGGKT